MVYAILELVYANVIQRLFLSGGLNFCGKIENFNQRFKIFFCRKLIFERKQRLNIPASNKYTIHYEKNCPPNFQNICIQIALQLSLLKLSDLNLVNTCQLCTDLKRIGPLSP